MREISLEELSTAEHGYTIDDDIEDEPVLLDREGKPVETWREGYPYDEKLARSDYERDKRRLQIELLKLQRWSDRTGARHLILFEGRDAAGKGSTIRRFAEHLNPRGARVVALDKPTDREKSQWYFQRYVRHLPAGGRDRAFRPVLVQPGRGRTGHGLASAPDRNTPSSSGTHRFSSSCWSRRAYIWPSSGVRCRRRSSAHASRSGWWIRSGSGKFSPMDMESVDRWHPYTEAKEAMFAATDIAPWIVVKSNDKKRARLNAMRHVLSKFEYDDKEHDAVGTPDPLIVGRALTD